MSPLSRRHALKLLAASTAATMAACSRPAEEIVPYVHMRERLVPGEPLCFATSSILSGYGRGVIGTTFDGRPTKLEGNPLHPASLGGTDVFMQGDILDLYDPARAKLVRGRLPVETWGSFARAFAAARARTGDDQTFALRILTGRITSPTFLRLWSKLQQTFPAARWHRYEPLDDDDATRGHALALGRRLLVRPRLSDAEVVLCLAADPLGPGPEQPALARSYADKRNPQRGFSRIYACESAWSATGANGDHRIALSQSDLIAFAWRIAGRLGAQGGVLPQSHFAHEADLVADDLKTHRGRAVVLAGPAQPPQLHALVAWMNDAIAAPLDYIAPIDPVTEPHETSFQTLKRDLDSGSVDALIVIGANPVYDRGAEFAQSIAKARFSARLSLHDDETSQACQWQLPLSHTLESWSDVRGPDGTASIVQPLITPLYESRTPHGLIALLGGDARTSDYELVRQTWQPRANGDFESWWRGVLEKGVVNDTAAQAVAISTPKLPAMHLPSAQRFELHASPDPSLWDGRYANNAWLQECPKPLTKHVWGNAIEISPEDANALGLRDGDSARLSCGLASIEGPVSIREHQARGTIVVLFGNGRSRVGPIGNDVGFNVFPLWLRRAEAVSIAKSERAYCLHTTSGHAELDAEEDKLYPQLSLAGLAGIKGLEQPPSTLPTLLHQKEDNDGYAWAMVIDNALCIGCNACVVACQSENNVPVVGPDEIDRHREMHWIRIDTYQRQDQNGTRVGFEPVPCMHCEDAPCEPVCPVEASVHDTEGLNVQVYNRCIGTRFCEANCPYKVRRFNWFAYASGQGYKDMDAPPISAVYNPDVTVRARGVMEKCTYCVQRVTRARRKAEGEQRQIREREIVTACEAACPTHAIVFGNLEDPHSQVSVLKADKRHFTLMGELGTRPRTTYLAHVSNFNPDWSDPA